MALGPLKRNLQIQKNGSDSGYGKKAQIHLMMHHSPEVTDISHKDTSSLRLIYLRYALSISNLYASLTCRCLKCSFMAHLIIRPEIGLRYNGCWGIILSALALAPRWLLAWRYGVGVFKLALCRTTRIGCMLSILDNLILGEKCCRRLEAYYSWSISAPDHFFVSWQPGACYHDFVMPRWVNKDGAGLHTILDDMQLQNKYIASVRETEKRKVECADGYRLRFVRAEQV